MPAERSYQLALVQMPCNGTREQNLERALTHTRNAAAAGADVICLPELFLGPYFCQTEDDAVFALAEPVPGPTTTAFEHVCRETGATVLLSLFERRAPGLYHNTLAVMDGADGYVGMYRKMHIPDDPRYYEKYYFTPGDLGFRCFRTERARIGTLVCWDQWYPEAARLTALQGAQVLVYPTAIGWHPEEREQVGAAQREAWRTIQRSHAVANGCYVAAVNRVGFEPEPGAPAGNGIEFFGSSFIAGPDGQIIAEAGSDEECVLMATIEPARLATQRHGWPFLRDRRIDAYDALTRRYLD